MLYRRGTRDEFNSDWSLSITSSLGTLFSSPSSSPLQRRGPTLLISLLATAISRLTLSPSLSLSISLSPVSLFLFLFTFASTLTPYVATVCFRLFSLLVYPPIRAFLFLSLSLLSSFGPP